MSGTARAMSQRPQGVEREVRHNRYMVRMCSLNWRNEGWTLFARLWVLSWISVLLNKELMISDQLHALKWLIWQHRDLGESNFCDVVGAMARIQWGGYWQSSEQKLLWRLDSCKEVDMLVPWGRGCKVKGRVGEWQRNRNAFYAWVVSWDSWPGLKGL